MLGMDQVHVIRHKVLVEGGSIRGVARQMGVSRNTVRKYLGVSEPVRQEGGPRERPVLEKVAPRIEVLLGQWGPRTTPKQRLTGSRIHRQLVEEGYRVGITTVREYLRERRRQAQEVYIPLIHRPGDEAQVDFFEVTVEEGGIVRKAWKFVMRLMYSGRDFVRLYDRCDQLCFLDAHVRAFGFFGAVPRRVVYDNLRAAVKRRVGIHVEYTDRFRALMSHYLFEPCLARPGQGHDKGGVESRGKGLRLQHLTPIPVGKTLASISEALLSEIDGVAEKEDREGKSILERFRDETGCMLPLPTQPFEARHMVMVSVSKQALVKIEGATYSVPSHWARLHGTAYVGVEDIRIMCYGESFMVSRQRRGCRHVRYRHYLSALAQKPQAVRQVAPELLEELGEPYGRLWGLLIRTYGERDAARVMAKLLGVMVDHGEDAVGKALCEVLGQGRLDLLALRSRLHGEPRKDPIPVPEPLGSYQVDVGQTTDYDWLLLGERP
jgi:transposase